MVVCQAARKPIPRLTLPCPTLSSVRRAGQQSTMQYLLKQQHLNAIVSVVVIGR
jgi:hypothetical protein